MHTLIITTRCHISRTFTGSAMDIEFLFDFFQKEKTRTFIEIERINEKGNIIEIVKYDDLVTKFLER